MHRDTGDVLDGLAELIAATDPEVVVLQEFKGYANAARNRFGNRWHLYARNDWAEANDNPVMVRKDVAGKLNQGETWGALRTRHDWHGPKGGVHHGRTWTWVRVGGVYVLSLHRCTGGKSQNAAAFGEEYDVLTDWIRRRGTVVILGDHNCSPSATFPGASRNIANATGGSIRTPPDGGIDYAIQRATNGHLTAHGKHGSDHPAVLWVRA